MIDNNNKGAIIKCANSDDVNKTSEMLQRKLGQDFEVTIQQPNNPKLKVIGISSVFDNSQLESDINNRNFYHLDNKCKVLHSFKSANNTKGAIIEVTKDLYEHIVNNKYRIYAGYHSCKAYDDFNVSLCNKCAGHNHKSSKCRNKKAKCIYCAGEHYSNECMVEDTKLYQCANCIYANEMYGHKYDTAHAASDVQCCEILKRKLNKMIADTDYPISPSLPKYIRPYLPFIKKKRKQNETNEVSADSRKTKTDNKELTTPQSTKDSMKQTDINTIPSTTLPYKNLKNNSKK